MQISLLDIRIMFLLTISTSLQVQITNNFEYQLQPQIPPLAGIGYYKLFHIKVARLVFNLIHITKDLKIGQGPV
jgi:hypothetical protein